MHSLALIISTHGFGYPLRVTVDPTVSLMNLLLRAVDEIRTRDILIGSQVLYQLSYNRINEPEPVS